MSPDEAAELHRGLTAGDGWCMWFATLTAPDYPGKAVAYVMTADHSGGTRQPGELVADTLDDLRAMMPPGLSRRDPTPNLSEGTVETWE